MLTADALIKTLGLAPHPEGGAFAETYRAGGAVPTRAGDRAPATAIYFLLRAGQHSAWHLVTSDELWFYHGGDALHLRRVSPTGIWQQTTLGLGEGQLPQALVPAGEWQAAVPHEDGTVGWTLVSCVVVPGFDFADFTLATVADMQSRFPQLSDALDFPG